MMNFRTIIDQWPKLPVFAQDIGVKYVTAQAMKRRDSVSPEHWPVMVESAARRGISGVTFQALATAYSERHSADDQHQDAAA